MLSNNDLLINTKTIAEIEIKNLTKPVVAAATLGYRFNNISIGTINDPVPRPF
jgi:hypothetical protein